MTRAGHGRWLALFGSTGESCFPIGQKSWSPAVAVERVNIPLHRSQLYTINKMLSSMRYRTTFRIIDTRVALERDENMAVLPSTPPDEFRRAVHHHVRRPVHGASDRDRCRYALLAREISPPIVSCGLEFITCFPTFSLTLSAAFFPDPNLLSSQEPWQMCRRTTEGFCTPQDVISMDA
jgi:hypothetical protein